MVQAKAIVVTGDMSLHDVSRMTNGMLAVAHPHLAETLTASQLVFLPQSAQGAVLTLPDLQEVAVASSTDYRTKLTVKPDLYLFGFLIYHIGRRLAFRVGDMHLGFGRRECAITTKGERVDFELVHWYDDPKLEAYTGWLRYAGNLKVAAASPEQAGRLSQRRA